MRLTNTLRNTIAGAVIAHRFNKPREDLSKQWRLFGDEVYCDIYDTKTRRLMDRLPDGWLCLDGSYYVSFGGLRDTLNMVHKRRFPYSAVQTSAPIKIYPANHPLAEKHSALRNALKDVEDERTKYRLQVEAVLDSVSTVSKLLEAWPEIGAFVPAAEAKAQVPALRIVELNAVLKLPPEKAA